MLCLLVGVGTSWAENFSTTYSYGLSGWSLTNYTDQSSYYQVPSGNDPSVATISNIFSGKTITSNVVVTINCATYGSGTNPSASTFSLYKETACTNAITASQGGTLPTSSTYTNVTYTVTQSNASSLGNDLAIKITKPGKTIRLKSIKVEFTYTAPSHTAHFSVNGTIDNNNDKDVTEGSIITFPSEPIVDGVVFMGWTKAAIDGTQEAAPVFVNPTATTMGDADVTYYAVFATQVVGGADKLIKITNKDQVENGVYAIISHDESYYLSNAKSTSAPLVTNVTKDGDDIVISDGMKWTLSIEGEKYILKSNASTAEEELYLWGAPTNDGVRVVNTSPKSNPFKTWELKPTSVYGLVLCHNTTGTTYRYLTTYSTQDWRNYEDIYSTNYASNLYKVVSDYTNYCTTVSAPAPTFASLDELIDANLEEETVVNVTIEDIVYGGMGNNGNYMVMLQNSEVTLVAPGAGYGTIQGGTVSGTLENVTWDPYNYVLSSEDGETFWASLEYTPAGATETITINSACTDGDYYYTTYSSTNAFYVSDDIEVFEVMTVNGEIALEQYKTNDLVPAYTGVLVRSKEFGTMYVEIETDPEYIALAESVLGEDNALRPTCTYGGVTAEDMEMDDPDCKYYRLTMHKGKTIGFWWGAAEGAGFELGNNKAYLAMPNSSPVKAQGLWFNNGETAIKNIETKAVSNKIFNLQGQRVNAAQKGIYIVNGKKVVK